MYRSSGESSQGSSPWPPNNVRVCVCVCVCTHACACSVTQLCSIICSLVNCSPPGSAVHGIPQARILEWVAISFSRGSSWSREFMSPAWQADFLALSHQRRPFEAYMPVQNRLSHLGLHSKTTYLLPLHFLSSSARIHCRPPGECSHCPSFSVFLSRSSIGWFHLYPQHRALKKTNLTQSWTANQKTALLLGVSLHGQSEHCFPSTWQLVNHSTLAVSFRALLLLWNLDFTGWPPSPRVPGLWF